MFARFAEWEPMLGDDRQWGIDAARAEPHVLDAHHLVDPTTGNGLSIAFFDDDVDLAGVQAAISTKAQEIGWNDVLRPASKGETIYLVVRHG